MARYLEPDADKMYRAVVNIMHENGHVDVHLHGPYTNRSTAAAQVTREIRVWSEYAYDVTGHVEISEVNWVKE